MSQQQKLSLRTRGELWIARIVKAVCHWQAQSLPDYVMPAIRVLEVGEKPAATNEIGTEMATIPKIIWAYWHQGEPPELIERCLNGWRRLHPGWRIEVLTADTAPQHVSHWPAKLAEATIHQRADWLRLALLNAHGGIWLDASTVLTQPLDWVLQAQQSHHTDCLGLYLDAFTRDPRYPIVEIGLLAAPPGSRFIGAVLHEFESQVIEHGAEAYVASLRKEGVLDQLCQAIDTPLYLTTHLAIQRVLQSGRVYRLGVWRSEDTGYTYHVQAGWDRARLKKRLFFMHCGAAVAPLIKLRGPDRKKLDLYLAQGLYLPDSLIGRYLMEAKP